MSGGLPKLLDFFQDKQDKKHELALAQIQVQSQLEMQKAGFQAQEHIEEIRTDQISIQAQTTERQALYAHDIEIGKGAVVYKHIGVVKSTEELIDLTNKYLKVKI